MRSGHRLPSALVEINAKTERSDKYLNNGNKTWTTFHTQVDKRLKNEMEALKISEMEN